MVVSKLHSTPIQLEFDPTCVGEETFIVLFKPSLPFVPTPHVHNVLLFLMADPKDGPALK
jgi:hypothetical protein